MNLWRATISEVISDAVRLAIWCVLAVNILLVAFFSVWLVAKLLWFAAGWCNRVLFSGNW